MLFENEYYSLVQRAIIIAFDDINKIKSKRSDHEWNHF